ncbi:MAG: ankyrin repeat domain-containing protein [Pseudomonadota bacterium]
MASKTRLLALIKTYGVEGIIAGLQESPELLEFRDERGRNWLHLCASVDVMKKPDLNVNDSVRLAEKLLGLGLDINAPAFTEGAWQATPLWYAVGRGHNLPLASFLLEHGSMPEHCLWVASFNEDFEMLRLLIKHGAPLETVVEGETPLLGAVKYSKFQAAKVLLDAGANPDFQDTSGMTALHCMLKKSSDKQHYQMFLKHKARGDIPNAEGKTAIDLMRRKRDSEYHEIAAQLVTK